MVSRRLFAATLGFFAATARGTACPATTCHAVHLFLARGNNEPYPGRQSAIVSSVCSGLPSSITCGYEDLVYSALYTDLSCQSTYSGAIAGHLQMTKYAEACPDSKLVLAGYSQGAQIVTDILGGGGGVSFNGCVQPETPGLDRGTKPGSMVAAALVFGNTRHTGSQPYNFGNGSALDGLFPRPASQLTALQAYASVLRDWCLSTDPICAANQADSQVAAHLGYYNVYAQAAGDWIKTVVGLTATASGVVTTVPGSLSGTAQDYATIGTATPSGTVTLDTTWTEQTSIISCTVESSSSAPTRTGTVSSTGSSTIPSLTSTQPSSVSSTSSTSVRASSGVTSSSATITSAGLASQTTNVASSTSAAVAGVFEACIIRIGIVVVVMACL